ncbi:hypothetical protein NE237_006882 [Protea cynaroides]|uniref:Uncharacterized protein n=1 Tax=Protea cynaroides TaxID=273540 RepID=A0A9Q0QVQ5_9MAGN|nr:hypothetical protein NE237_006882 [Protea cynaroides]
MYSKWVDAAEDEDSKNDDDDVAYDDEEVEGVEEGEIQSPKEGVISDVAQPNAVASGFSKEGAESSGQNFTSSLRGTLMVCENGQVEVIFLDVESADRALLNAKEALQMSAGAFIEKGKHHCGHPRLLSDMPRVISDDTTDDNSNVENDEENEASFDDA